MQAIIVIGKKILTLIHTLAKKKENYNPEKSIRICPQGAVKSCRLKQSEPVMAWGQGGFHHQSKEAANKHKTAPCLYP